MCRVIISREHNHNFASANETSKRKLRQRGDVVEILEDSQYVGKKIEGNPRFIIINIPTVKAKRLSRLLESTNENDRREFRLSMTKLRDFVTAKQKAEIRDGKPIAITKEILGECLQNRITKVLVKINTILRSE